MSSGDWNEIFEEVEAEHFVGREQELESFRQQISLTKPRYLIFYITGQGGAGKTTLLNRYKEIAEEHGFLLTDCDEQQRDMPTVLGRFAQQLTDQGFSLRRFNELYKTYRQKRHEIENDPEAPQGLAAMLARTVVRATFIGGDTIPGIRKGLEYLPREAIETQASEWATYLAKKFSNKDELALMREPVDTLTPLFFEGMNEIAQKQKVLLCFDNFEAALPEVQDWLLRLREHKPSLNIRIAIAGRNQPGAAWDKLRKVTLVNSLDIFDEREAEAFLDTYGIADPERRKEILEFSGRLPVLMSWLSTPGGQDTDSAIPTHDIVERFLRWIPKSRQQTALLAAIPRSFNVDILKLLMDNSDQHDDASSIFDWLLTMSFVQQRLDGWQYHPVVRRLMLRYQRQRSPDTYQRLHTRLAEFYNAKRHEINSSIKEEWTNEEWRSCTLAYAYHYLVADPVQHWSEIISLFVVALHNRRSFATEILELLNSEDVRDELSREQNDKVELVRQQMAAIDAGTLRDGFQMFDKLCTIPGLSCAAKCYVLNYRGIGSLLRGKSEKALSDFEDAIRIMPEDAWVVANRGICYFLIGRYSEALTDLDHVNSLEKEDFSAFVIRGIIHGVMGHLQEALADLDRANSLDKDEGDFWIPVFRGIVHSFLGHYPEALTDFERSFALAESDTWKSTSQTLNYLIDSYPEVLADWGRAMVSGQVNTWFSNHHQINYLISQPPDMLENFVKLIAFDETKNVWVSAIRGFIYMLMKRYEEAIADFSQIIILDEKNTWFIASRGLAYMLMKRYEEAIADFSQAITLDEKNAWFIATRGDTYRKLGHYKEALADYSRAIVLDDTVAWVFDHRGQVYQAMGHYEEALSDIDHAIALGYGSYNSRGLVLSYLERYDEAINSYEQGLIKNPNDYMLLYNIAISMVRWKGLPYAQKYMDIARTVLQSEVIAGVRGTGLYGLGGLEAVVGNFDTALDYLEQAITDKEKAIDWARQDMAWADLRARKDLRFRSLIPPTG